MGVRLTYEELLKENTVFREHLKSQNTFHIINSQLQQLSKIGAWELDLNSLILTLKPETNFIISNELKETSYSIIDFYEKYAFNNEDSAIVKEQLAFAIKNKNNKAFTGSFIYRVLTSEGEVKSLKVAYLFKSENVLMGVTIDITEQKKAQDALKQSEFNLRSLFSSMSDIVFEMDYNGTYLYIAPTSPKLMYKLPNEVLGKTLHEVFPLKEAERFLSVVRRSLDESKTISLEYPLIIGDDIIWFEGKAKPKTKNSVIFTARDITSQKKVDDELILANEKIEKSEKKFRELFEKSGHANLIIENGLFVDCNQSAVEMLAYKNKREVINTHPSDISPKLQPDGKSSIEKANEMMKIAIINGTHRFEWNHKKSNGLIFPCEVLLTNIYSDSIKTIIHAVITDISQRKKTEKELILAKEKAEESEMQFRAISEQSTEGITVADFDGNYIFVNPSFCKMSGYTSDELLKLTVFDMKAKNQPHKSFFDSKYKMEGLAILVNLQKKDGTEYMTEIIGKIINIKNQQLVLGTIRDVSEKIKKEKEILVAKERAEKSEEQFRAIVDQSPLSIQIFDKTGMTVHVNSAWETIWHSNKDMVVGKYNVLDDDYADETGWLKYLKRAFNGETVFLPDMEYDPYKSGNTGRKRILKCITFPIFLKNNVDQVIIIHQDVTEIRKNQLELIKAKEQAEESDRLKSAFLANMSHEIRTPMNGIMGFTSLLKEPDLSPKEKQQFVEVIERSGFRLLGIINDLIDISKIESGSIQAIVSKVCLKEQMNYLYAFFTPEVDSKGMELFFDNNQSDLSIATDKEKFLAILTNLIKNAIKYSVKGSIHVGFKQKKNMLEFYVADSGVGISSNEIESIFDRFIQADNHLSSAIEGAGLGLAITKAYVKLLGGEIWVNSVVAKGSTFYFTLPK